MPLLRPRVVTAWDVRHNAAMPGAGLAVIPIEEEDNYVLKLTKYIPAEIVAVYQFTAGMLATWKSSWSPWVWLGWVAFLAIFTVVWIPYATSDAAHRAHKYQVYSAVVAFLVWAFAVGGGWEALLPAGFADARPVIGALSLCGATLLIPLLEKVFPPSAWGLPRVRD